MATQATPYKKVLIIGATSGIGRALTQRFLAVGTPTVAVGRRSSHLDELRAAAPDGLCTTTVFDITDLASIPSFASAMVQNHPDLDCVILNAGLQRAFNFHEPASVDLATLDHEVVTNYLAHVHLAMAFLPHLQSEGKVEASLVFVTSGLALVPMLRPGNYCATKAALHAFVLVLREQLRASGSRVKVVEVLPPAVQTELHSSKNQPDMGPDHKIGMPLEEFTDKAWKGLVVEGKEQVPVGMPGESFYAPEGFETKRQEFFHKFIAMAAERDRKQKEGIAH